jgi:hypothetical protein
MNTISSTSAVSILRDQFRNLRRKASTAYKSDAAMAQVSLIGATVAVFSTIMVIIACYLGLDMITPMFMVNGTLPSNIQDVITTAEMIFKIILTCLSFVGIGLLVSVVRGWVGGE